MFQLFLLMTYLEIRLILLSHDNSQFYTGITSTYLITIDIRTSTYLVIIIWIYYQSEKSLILIKKRYSKNNDKMI